MELLTKYHHYPYLLNHNVSPDGYRTYKPDFTQSIELLTVPARLQMASHSMVTARTVKRTLHEVMQIMMLTRL